MLTKLEHTKKYPAKVILFGEYSVLRGSGALAIPYTPLSAYWEKTADAPDLTDFVQYLLSLEHPHWTTEWDTHALQQYCLREGWRLHSDIPHGYGIGSSGALCAALYDAFAVAPLPLTDLSALRQQLALMEGYFHANSSGLDPLVSYTQSPIVWAQHSLRTAPELPTDLLPFTLIDTEQPRQATLWIQRFQDRCQERAFSNGLEEVLVPAVRAAITAYVAQDKAALWESLCLISRWQFIQMRDWIPAAFHGVWEQGLRTRQFAYKLCGAGGGGFLLRFEKP